MKFKQSPLYLCTLMIAFAFLLQSCQEEEIISPVGEELQNKSDKIKIKKKTVAIPDENFELALIELNIDSGEPDGLVLQSSVENVTELLITEKNISNLSGIEYFSSLEILNLWGNQLTSLDVSKNRNLVFLDCSLSPLDSLDVSNNKALEMLVFDNTLISNIDVSKNLALKHLSYSSWYEPGLLSNIDLRYNLALEVLWCDNNQVIDLDLSNNTALKELWCQNNQISNLDVSQNSALITLYCINNPDLSCIQVNESQLANTVNGAPSPWWWTKDETANYSLSCP